LSCTINRLSARNPPNILKVSNIDQIFVCAGINLPQGSIVIDSAHSKTGFGTPKVTGRVPRELRAADEPS
jgi:hypothetical protein